MKLSSGFHAAWSHSEPQLVRCLHEDVWCSMLNFRKPALILGTRTVLKAGCKFEPPLASCPELARLVGIHLGQTEASSSRAKVVHLEVSRKSSEKLPARLQRWFI